MRARMCSRRCEHATARVRVNLRAHEVWLAMRVPLQFKFCVCYDFGCYLTYLCSCAQCSYRCPIFWCSRQFGADPQLKRKELQGFGFPGQAVDASYFHAQGSMLKACCKPIGFWLGLGYVRNNYSGSRSTGLIHCKS